MSGLCLSTRRAYVLAYIDLYRVGMTVHFPRVGFVQLRPTVWPRLLGLAPAMDPAGSREAHRGGRCSSDPEDEAEAVVRDRHVIGCDIDRSLWAFTQGGSVGGDWRFRDRVLVCGRAPGRPGLLSRCQSPHSHAG